MPAESEKIIRVGSRKSELAIIQTKYVIARLQKIFPGKKFEIHTMSTMGDRVLNISLPKIGEKSLFTRDLEESLRNGGVDFVVHSLKDLPTVLPTGMAIGAVLEREDARDALVLRANFKGHTIQTLPKGSVIGTSSLRRTAQLRRLYSHLSVCDIRGNLNTRLAKLDDPSSKFAGIILAQAGLVRMGWMDRISQVLEPSDLLYAVGQGALAVECRANDDEVLTMLQNLMCLSTTCRILAERSFLKTLGGGCSAPVAVCSNLLGDVGNMNGNNDAGLSLVGAVWSLDGHTEIRDKLGCELLDATHKRTAEMLKREADVANDHPPQKRKRNSELSCLVLPEEDETPVINDDLQSPELAAAYNMEELIGKHMHLAKKCPIMGAETEANHINNNIINNNNNASNTAPRNGGDADQLVSTSCPIKIDVGQDFMGQCPFFNSETKVALASVGKCPLTKAESTPASVDETDHAIPSTSMRLLSTLTKLSTSGGGGDGLVKSALDASHGKCPFLQKTVQMFDYSDEEQPLPHKVPLLIEDVDNLFCGLFQHKCHSRDLYSRCNRLGQQLAENLIKQGALDIMRVAQAEIHSKS